MVNFIGTSKSSVRNQPPIFTSLPVGLYNSIASGEGSPKVSASFTTIPGRGGGLGSRAPGDPLTFALARQLLGRPGGALGFVKTSENPGPSVVRYQSSR